MTATPYTLLRLQREVKEQLRSSFSSRLWVVAEIGQLNIASIGHCYMELVERNETNSQLSAKCQATIWKGSLNGILHRFRSSTGSELSAGMKILAYVEVNYHELYGISLNISDIDPSFTIGEMELQRKAIIKKLTDSGDIKRNSLLELPQLIQRIAVVSSSQAAGYGDFYDELFENEYGYDYNITLFNAIMQGSDAENSIINALEKIYDNYEKFDCIIIIRGGGSKSDLSCFDNYNLAQMIAYSPLPVISGIGHDRDESIVDMVSAISLKTPTAVARFLIDYSLEKENQLDEMVDYINHIFTHEIKTQEQLLIDKSRNIEKILSTIIKEQTLYFALSQQKLESISANLINKRFQELDAKIKNTKEYTYKFLKDKSNILELQGLQNDNFNPQHIFALGYSFARAKGKIIRSASDVKLGDNIEIKLSDGLLDANIINITNG